MKISTVLDQIDLGSMALPEFQRGYVWNREQVRDLMQSLYRKYPVGGLLVWKTRTDAARTRGGGNLSSGTVDLLLDGQQRITSLYGIIKGKPPRFFDGNVAAFTGLYFHLEDEVFEFYAPLRMQGNPLWVDVTELMKEGGLGKAIQRLTAAPEVQSRLNTYLGRLTAINAIKDVDLHVEQVTGEDKTVDVVVDIFKPRQQRWHQVVQGRSCAGEDLCGMAGGPRRAETVPGQMEKCRLQLQDGLAAAKRQHRGHRRGVVNALRDVDTPTFQEGLVRAEKYVDALLNLISARLGLDHDRVLGGRYAFPVMSRYLHQNGEKLSYVERDKLLHWYVHSFLWGRYAGSTETVIN